MLYKTSTYQIFYQLCADVKPYMVSYTSMLTF